MRVLMLLAALLVCTLSACGLQPLEGDSESGAGAGARESDASRVVHNDLILGMLAQKQYYAALAHIQQQENQLGALPELRLLEAEARRNLEQYRAAEALYKGLFRTDFAAEAYHGLGLLYARTGTGDAVWLLQQAVQRRPTDAQMRNDLGYGLMMAGRYRDALPQLATAAELDPQGNKSRNNLIVLLLLTHDEARAKKVAAQSGTSDKTMAGLRRQAAELALKSKAGG